jgi:hypothetical protein
MQRYSLPELKIVLKLSEGTFKAVKLVDISLNSVKFVAAFPLIEGQDIVIRFQFPQIKFFSMKGFTLRVEEFPETDRQHTIVVKFYPFSTYERYNLMENRKLLQKILSHGEVTQKGSNSKPSSSPWAGSITAA